MKEVRKEGKHTYHCDFYMAIPYHEQMHTAIWTWIREYSTTPECGGRDAGDILQEIISRIPHQYPPSHPDAVAPSYLSPTGNIPDMLGSFSEQMCTVAEHLHRRGELQRISWYDMKRILQYYLSDAIEYIRYIDSLDWDHHQVNSYFGLNLNDLNYPAVMSYPLLWDRYLTGTRIYHPTENPQHSGEMFVVEMLARGEEYWGSRVSEDIFGIQEEEMILENIFRNQENFQEGELTKKKEALKKIQAIVDEVSDDIGDGAYLKLMNVMKEEWSS